MYEKQVWPSFDEQTDRVCFPGVWEGKMVELMSNKIVYGSKKFWSTGLYALV